jgi:hypothetical protein
MSLQGKVMAFRMAAEGAAAPSCELWSWWGRVPVPAPGFPAGRPHDLVGFCARGSHPVVRTLGDVR